MHTNIVARSGSICAAIFRACLRIIWVCSIGKSLPGTCGDYPGRLDFMERDARVSLALLCYQSLPHLTMGSETVLRGCCSWATRWWWGEGCRPFRLRPSLHSSPATLFRLRPYFCASCPHVRPLSRSAQSASVISLGRVLAAIAYRIVLRHEASARSLVGLTVRRPLLLRPIVDDALVNF